MKLTFLLAKIMMVQPAKTTMTSFPSLPSCFTPFKASREGYITPRPPPPQQTPLIVAKLSLEYRRKHTRWRSQGKLSSLLLFYLPPLLKPNRAQYLEKAPPQTKNAEVNNRRTLSRIASSVHPVIGKDNHTLTFNLILGVFWQIATKEQWVKVLNRGRWVYRNCHQILLNRSTAQPLKICSIHSRNLSMVSRSFPQCFHLATNSMQV